MIDQSKLKRPETSDLFDKADDRMKQHPGHNYMSAFITEVKDAVHSETWENIMPLYFAANRESFQRTIKNARFYDRVEKILLWLNESDGQMINKADVYRKITEAMDVMTDYGVIDKS